MMMMMMQDTGDSMSHAKVEERRICCRLDDLTQDVNGRDRRLLRIFHLECTTIGEVLLPRRCWWQQRRRSSWWRVEMGYLLLAFFHIHLESRMNESSSESVE